MAVPIDAGFILIEAMIFLGACVWVFVRLEKIEQTFGSFDIYWQIFIRAIPLQVAVWLLYLLAGQFI